MCDLKGTNPLHLGTLFYTVWFLCDILRFMDNKKLIVYKANEVIEAGYRLSLNEQRVVLACISQVNSAEKLLVTDKFELSAKNFSSIFSVSEKRAYHSLVEVADSLFNRYVIIDNPQIDDPEVTRLKTHWISSIRYKEDSGKITLCFAQDMLPYLSELKGTFTRYEIKHIGKMTSIYAIRLYELLMQWKTTGKREIEIEWLKQQFQIEGKYSTIKNLKMRVIEPAVKDINTHSDYTVEWIQRKTGRKVTHLTFIFDKKELKTPPKPRNKEPMINGVTKSEIARKARTGESWEDAAFRIKAERLAAKSN